MSNCGSIRCLSLYAIIGVSGFLICGLSCGIALVSVKKWRSWKAHTRPFIHQDKSVMLEPVYDTIDPVYEIQIPNDSKVIDMAEMTNNEAYLTMTKLSQDYMM